MLVVFYFVVLLQLSIGQDLTENEVDTQEVGMAFIANHIVEEESTLIDPPPTIQPEFIEDLEATSGNDIQPVDKIPFSDENYKDEDTRDLKESFGDPIPISDENDKDEDTEDLNEPLTSIDPNSLSDENDKNENSEELKEPLTFGGTVKAQGKVTIATHYGYDNDNNGLTTNEEVAEVTDEPISFNGCVKAQGKVTIAGHFGCDDSNKNFVETIKSEAIVDEEDIPDEPVSFAGPVHAQGKITIGTHYGCGGPIGMPPTMLPLPYFTSFIYPPPYHSSYFLPGSFLAQYPFPMPETKPFKSPVFQDSATDSGSFEDSQDLPVASNLANMPVSESGEDNQHGMTFNGVVPACGTVSIAARF